MGYPSKQHSSEMDKQRESTHNCNQEILILKTNIHCLLWETRPHCDHTATTMRPHCDHTATTLRLHCAHTVATLRQHCDHTATTLRPHCDHTATHPTTTLRQHCDNTATLRQHCDNTATTISKLAQMTSLLVAAVVYCYCEQCWACTYLCCICVVFLQQFATVSASVSTLSIPRLPFIGLLAGLPGFARDHCSIIICISAFYF